MQSREDDELEADRLLRQAAATDNLAEKSRLIGEAARARMRVVEAEGRTFEGAPEASQVPDLD